MAFVERYLTELESLKTQAAIDSLKNPESKDSYGFGVAVGIQRGLEMAQSKLDEVIRGEEENEPIHREGSSTEPLIKRRESVSSRISRYTRT